MNARQITLPLRLPRAERHRNSSHDLIGRSYLDCEATVTVVDVCFNDEGRVIVQRDLDGHTWSMPAWLMRLIFMEKKRKRAA